MVHIKLLRATGAFHLPLSFALLWSRLSMHRRVVSVRCGGLSERASETAERTKTIGSLKQINKHWRLARDKAGGSGARLVMGLCVDGDGGSKEALQTNIRQ